jgi:hypothetical protein
MSPGTLCAAALMAVAAATAAQSPQDQPAQTPEVTVVGGPAPKVLASVPADGASVPGGVLVLKITFDQPMTPDSWSYGPGAAGAFPHCLAQPRLLTDERTFALLCTVAEHQAYAVEINAAPVFANATGRRAGATVLRFSRTGAVTRDMHDALLQAGLTDLDEPIMSWRDDGVGVSRSPDPPDTDN